MDDSLLMTVVHCLLGKNLAGPNMDFDPMHRP